MEQRKPRSRKKTVTDDSKGIRRRGEGLSKASETAEKTVQEKRSSESDAEDGRLRGSRPAGPQQAHTARSGGARGTSPGQPQTRTVRSGPGDPYNVSARDDSDPIPVRPASGGGGTYMGGGQPVRKKSGGGCRKYVFLLVLLVCAYFVVSYFMNGLSQQGGGGGTSTPTPAPAPTQQTTAVSNAEAISQGNGVQTGWVIPDTNEVVTEEVAPEAREKYTTILGDGKDVVTIMVYMCGTDLESKSGMGTSDLQEMLNAEVGDHINLIIMTGGCKQWRNNVISNQYNQIYQIKNGQLLRIVDNAGTGSMTDGDNLRAFIEFCAQNYPANRYELILWDHGTGSVYGYAYDEKYPRSGQMTIEQIDRALTSSGVKFDFVGFDACLMANVETALMLGDNADYLIASEEVEPGVGWYYTDWLTAFSRDPSMPTLDVGIKIADTFYARCKKQTPGQPTTLSVVDLAELSQTLPPVMKTFSQSTSAMIDGGQFSTVSRARSTAKEFARGQNIDQIDMVHFAKQLHTEEGDALAETIQSAVKYKIASSDVANAYGLSVYFPYNSVRQVDVAKVIYSAIGMDDSYSDLLTRFARYQVGGQATSGGYSTPSYQLFGQAPQSGYSGQSSSSQYQEYGSVGYDDMLTILEYLMGGRMGDVGSLGIDGLTDENASFLADENADIEAMARMYSQARLTQEDVTWKVDGDTYYLELNDEQWGQLSRIDMATFVDDGEVYIDLGLDNIYDIDGNRLIPETDGTWIAINGQPMAYYHCETLDVSDEEYSIRGRVPVLLNGDRADLIIVFDQDNEDGYIAGATFDYADDETTAIPKTLEGLAKGDTVEFIATCYNYDGTVDDQYVISDPFEIEDPEDIRISNVDVTNSGTVHVMYCLTDIYGQKYWTTPIELK
ncbi:MAG: peptidase C11 [Mogibacterium sp.]|nr:peptidase C11 [Mogibacterium sp.]